MDEFWPGGSMPLFNWKRLLAGILPCAGEARVRGQPLLQNYTGSGPARQFAGWIALLRPRACRVQGGSAFSLCGSALPRVARFRAVLKQYTKAGCDLWQLDADAARTFNSVVHDEHECATNSPLFSGDFRRFQVFPFLEARRACCSLLRIFAPLNPDGAALRVCEPFGGARERGAEKSSIRWHKTGISRNKRSAESV